MAVAPKKKKETKVAGGNVLVIGKFASTSQADASVNGGTSPASIFYNSTTNKLMVKEGTSWKTVTTS